MNKTIINQRFIEAFNILYEAKIINKKTKFAYEIGVSPQILSEMLGERMNISLKAIQYICKKYNVNYAYIFEGQGVVIKDQYTSPESPVIVKEPQVTYNTGKEQLLLKMIKEKDQRIEELNIIIGKQKNIIENLKKEIPPGKNINHHQPDLKHK